MTSKLLTFFLLVASQLCKGLDSGPEILRICLDNKTSIATLYWNPPFDNCNSFKYYKIYSSENNGPWIKKTTIPIIGLNQYRTFIPDLTSDWRFKIVTYTSCNGIDSFISKDQSIDQNKPSLIELDSVSFDFPSQKLSAGWKKNPTIDTKGYWLYNYVSPIIKILDTESTFTIFYNFDKLNPSKIAIATYDSCNYFAPISAEQQSAYLSGKIDTCLKSITLNWSPYLGWTEINQYLVLNRNSNGFSKLTTLLPSNTSLTISNIILGDNLCYYIRTENKITHATSSSNTICFQTRKFIDPKINYLSNVTIENNTSLKGYFKSDNKTDIDSFYIEKQDVDLIFKPFLQLASIPNISEYSFQDLSADFNNHSYSYRIKTSDKCKNITSLSNIGQTIYLNKQYLNDALYGFTWNPYKYWENGVASQSIEISSNRFTWNLLKTESSKIALLQYSIENAVSDSVCFRINNIEELNSYNTISISTSNIQCIYNVGNFYFPQTINPYSNNNVFRIYGKGYDRSKGLIEIFNRWGEKIYETNLINVGWDGKVNGEYSIQGTYIYKAAFYDQRNKYYFRTGTIFIIR